MSTVSGTVSVLLYSRVNRVGWMTCCCVNAQSLLAFIIFICIATRNTCGLILATSKMYPNVSKRKTIQEEQGHCIVKTDWALRKCLLLSCSPWFSQVSSVRSLFWDGFLVSELAKRSTGSGRIPSFSPRPSAVGSAAKFTVKHDHHSPKNSFVVGNPLPSGNLT